MDKEALINLVKEIQNRVEIAAKGQRHTDDWNEEYLNLSAPDGMDYWSWIDDAEQKAIAAIEKLKL